MTAVKFYWNVLKDSLSKFGEDDIFTHAAALSYYTIFSLPPMLLIILYIMTLFYSESDVKDLLFSEMGDLVGKKGTKQLIATIENLEIFKPSVWATVMGAGVLIFTSTTVFVTMQAALNKIFRVKADPDSGVGILNMLKDRVLSFSLLIGVAFVLLVSLAVNSVLSAFSGYLQNHIGEISYIFSLITSVVVPLLVITLLFAAIFKLLPDAKLKWRDVWFGAFLTSGLFGIGKYLISFYIGNSNVAGLYDAAGSIMVIMVWVFYASVIFMFGAALTYVRMKKMGDRVEASDYAKQYEVIEKEKTPQT